MGPQIVVDRYRLMEPIRQRGMATTFCAIDEQDGQTVALKLVPLPHGDPRHFEREFSIGSRLSHPNLLRYLRCFHTKDFTGQVTELVEGEPFLSALPRPEQNTMGASATSAFRQLCETIAYLHDQGLVHANLSPQVILLTPTGSLKLIDLGHCETLVPGADSWTGGPHGTPIYMSPEHLEGPLRVESDYFVVGVLLAEYFSGKNPFRGSNLRDILDWIEATDGLQTLLLPHTPPKPWRDIVNSLLSAVPSRRHAGWRDLLASSGR